MGDLFPYFVFLLFGGTFAQTSPTATVKNGTYVGKFVPEWNQDQFLGMPYAVPPVGDLRFAFPRSLNTSFDEPRNATEYGSSCYQYGPPPLTITQNLSEDCLTLNVIRPGGFTANDSLPVLVWIYGGGLTSGSSADPQYNLSGITAVSQRINKPIITVSINYRLAVWGFLQTPQILAEGSSNAGLLDQRLALQWIKENIASFGGDPNRITIWGESAGAQSIGLHLHSFGGRDDGLFSAAIMESGGPVGVNLEPLAYYASPVENLTRTTGCHTAQNQLACLRSLSPEQLFEAQVSQVWNPIVDGNFLTAYPSHLARENKFIHVPLLLGANSDEGTSFGSRGLDNATAIFNNLLTYRSYAITPDSARKLLELYPNDPANEPPFYIKTPTIFPSFGLQWRREAAIAGDIVMIGQRRKVCEQFTSAGLSVYSYRFDTPAWNGSVQAGAKHFVNVVFSFQNISGGLGPLPEFRNYTILSENIGLAYVSFVNDQNPNTSRGNSTLPFWPHYSLDNPQNMVLNSNKTFIEQDDFRKDGIDFINSIDREFLA